MYAVYIEDFKSSLVEVIGLFEISELDMNIHELGVVPLILYTEKNSVLGPLFSLKKIGLNRGMVSSLK